MYMKPQTHKPMPIHALCAHSCVCVCVRVSWYMTCLEEMVTRECMGMCVCASVCVCVSQPEGLKEMNATIAFYKENAAILRKCFQDMGFSVYGGADAPYVWVGFPGKASW